MNLIFKKSSYKLCLALICWSMVFVSLAQIGKALTVDEAISLLEQKRAAIQDYYFIISRSCYHSAYSQEKATAITQKVSEDMKEQIISRGGRLDSMTEKKIDRVADFNAFTLSHYEWNGNIYSLKGIGTQTFCYTMGSFMSSINNKMKEWLKSPQDEFSLDFTKNSTFELNEVTIHTPGIIGEFHLGESVPGTVQDIFQPAQSGVLNISELAQHDVDDRFIYFPFNYEKALVMAENAENHLTETSDGNLLLRIHPVDPPANRIFFELTFDKQGRVYKYSKIHSLDSSEEWVEFSVSYYEYVDLNPDEMDLQIPRMGILWMNEQKMDPTKMNISTIPLRETSIIMSILSATVNVGYGLEDISVSLPKGSSIMDFRGKPGKRIVLDEEKQITARNILESNFE